MSSAAEQLAALFDALGALPALHDELRRASKALHAQATAGAILSALEDGLHPHHAYAPEQAAQFLGVKVASFHSVSRTLLPRGRAGRVLGIDLMAYRADIAPEEAAAYKRAKRALVERALQRAA